MTPYARKRNRLRRRVVALYCSGSSLREVAETVGRSYGFVYDAVRDANALRPCGRPYGRGGVRVTPAVLGLPVTVPAKDWAQHFDLAEDLRRLGVRVRGQ